MTALDRAGQLSRHLLSVQDGFSLIFMVVVFLVLSFGLVNTLAMAVFERVREIGLMQALGMPPAMILGSCCWRAFICCCWALAWETCWRCSALSLWSRVSISPVSPRAWK